MLSGRVVGTIVSTRKAESLVGSKFLEVQLVKNGMDTEEYLIAIDTVGAGIGEKVLVTTGSGARFALADSKEPADAAIVGIID